MLEEGVLHRDDINDLDRIGDVPMTSSMSLSREHDLARDFMRPSYLPSIGLVGVVNDFATPVVDGLEFRQLETGKGEITWIGFDELHVEAVSKAWCLPFRIAEMDSDHALKAELKRLP